MIFAQLIKDQIISGWVAIHGPGVRGLFSGQEPGLHKTCVAELNKHFVFVAADKGLLPKSPGSLIAEGTVGDAEAVCNHLANHCLVFMTKSADEKPKLSIVVKFEDWQSVIRLRQSDAAAPGDRLVRDSIPALAITTQNGLKFRTVVVNAQSLTSWGTQLFNVSERLSMNWRIRAGKIPLSELELHNLSEGALKELSSDQLPVIGRERGLYLVCHFFKYWEKTNLQWEYRAEDVNELLHFEKPLNKQRIRAEAVEAGCVRPSPHATIRRFKSLFSQARSDREFANQWVFKERLLDFGWLLAVVFPDNFAHQLAKGGSIRDLTSPSTAG